MWAGVSKHDNVPPQIKNLESEGCIVYQWEEIELKEGAARPQTGGNGGKRVEKDAKEASLYDELSSFSADAFVVNQGNTYGIQRYPFIFDFIGNTPYYLINHLNHDHVRLGTNARIIRRIFEDAERVFFVADANLKLAQRHLCSEIGNSEIVNNPIKPGLGAIPFPDVSDTVNFANVARLDVPFKGQDVLLECFSAEKWRTRNWRLNLYGRGPDRKYLSELIHFFDLSDKVSLRGYADDVRSVWKENHMLILPSAAEGTPLSLVEAMLCGRPAVVTDVGGNTELITHGENGFVAASSSKVNLDAALEEAWNSMADWSKLGDEGCRRARIRYQKDAAQELASRIVG